MVMESIADAYMAYADHDTTIKHSGDGTYGITDIGMLFPDHKTLSNTPAFIKRDTDWVSKVFRRRKACSVFSY